MRLSAITTLLFSWWGCEMVLSFQKKFWHVAIHLQDSTSLRYFAKRNENMSQYDVNIVHCSCIYSSQNCMPCDVMCPSTGEWTNCGDLVILLFQVERGRHP